MGAAGQRVTFRAPARITAIAASLAAAAALLLPSTALAATTVIGSAAENQQCNIGAFDSVQVSSSGASYAVPTGGTSIISWSVQAGADTGSLGLEVWRPTAPPTYTLVGSTPVTTLSANSLNTFTLATPMVVQAGDLLGLRVEGAVSCSEFTNNSSDVVGFSTPNLVAPTAGATALLSPIGFDEQLNVAATVDVTVAPPPPTPTPTTADQCKDGGWQGLTDSTGMPFKNQGDCVSFVATDGTNAGGGPPANAASAKNRPPADVKNAGGGPPANAASAGNRPPADVKNAGNRPPA